MRLRSVFLGLAMIMTVPAQAANCWTNMSVTAAQVRELHIMLLTVELRCRNINPEISASYDLFQVRHKATIFDAEEKLRAHYASDKNPTAKADFARFHTSLANFYGTGKTDANSCAMFNLVTRELAKESSDAGAMVKIAQDMVPEPRIDAPRCDALLKP
jgi:hypothetical protein